MFFKTVLSCLEMADVSLLLMKWRERLTRGKDFDAWGQFVEASEEYSRSVLNAHLRIKCFIYNLFQDIFTP